MMLPQISIFNSAHYFSKRVTVLLVTAYTDDFQQNSHVIINNGIPLTIWNDRLLIIVYFRQFFNTFSPAMRKMSKFCAKCKIVGKLNKILWLVLFVFSLNNRRENRRLLSKLRLVISIGSVRWTENSVLEKPLDIITVYFQFYKV